MTTNSTSTPISFYLVNSYIVEIRTNAWMSYSYYVWMGVFSLFNSSLYWSVITDMFDEDSGSRLFGLLAAGTVCVCPFG